MAWTLNCITFWRKYVNEKIIMPSLPPDFYTKNLERQLTCDMELSMKLKPGRYILSILSPTAIKKHPLWLLDSMKTSKYSI